MIPFGEHLDIENGKNSVVSEIFIMDYRHSFVSDQSMLQDAEKTYLYIYHRRGSKVKMQRYDKNK